MILVLTLFLELVQILESWACHLEEDFVELPFAPDAKYGSLSPNFPLSPAVVETLEDEIHNASQEYGRRVEKVNEIAENIVQLWHELDTPGERQDASILKHYRDSPEQLGLRKADLEGLESIYDQVTEEKKSREKKLNELRSLVESYWKTLDVGQQIRDSFLHRNAGFGLHQLNEYEDELARLDELKKQKIPKLVVKAFMGLRQLWTDLYMSEEEEAEFNLYWSGEFGGALFQILYDEDNGDDEEGHDAAAAEAQVEANLGARYPSATLEVTLKTFETESQRLEVLKEQRAPMLTLINRHRELVKDRDDLASASQDASRLMMRGQKGEKRDPTRLLREEKMRKRIAKELPKLTVDLRMALERFQDEYGRPFLVYGESYLEELEASEAKAAPARSRTPAPMAPPPKPTLKKANSTAYVGPSHNNNIMRPPTRNGAKTPVAGDTLKRGGPTRSVGQSGGTPTRLGRAPLLSLKYAAGSPERKPQTENRIPLASSSMSQMGPPARIPPPRMADLYEQPDETPTNQFRKHKYVEPHHRSQSVEQFVRPSHDDPYTDRKYGSVYERPPSAISSSSTGSVVRHDLSYRDDTLQAARHHSSNSTSATSVTSSSNWEVFPGSDSPEPQERPDEYYARAESFRNQAKRLSPGGFGPPLERADSKRNRGYSPPQLQAQTHDANGNRIFSGSEWTETDGE